jgi:hypothetical protein
VYEPSSYASKAELRRDILLVYGGEYILCDIYMQLLQVFISLHHSLEAIDYMLTRWPAFARFSKTDAVMAGAGGGFSFHAAIIRS